MNITPKLVLLALSPSLLSPWNIEAISALIGIINSAVLLSADVTESKVGCWDFAISWFSTKVASVSLWLGDIDRIMGSTWAIRCFAPGLFIATSITLLNKATRLLEDVKPFKSILSVLSFEDSTLKWVKQDWVMDNFRCKVMCTEDYTSQRKNLLRTICGLCFFIYFATIRIQGKIFHIIRSNCSVGEENDVYDLQMEKMFQSDKSL